MAMGSRIGSVGLQKGKADADYVNVTGDTMTGRLDGYLFIDTEANIFATTPNDNTLALATDTGYFYVYDGSNWHQSAIKLTTILNSSPDIGLFQDSSPVGYHPDYISDKNITHSRIGANDNTGEGQVRTSGGAFQWHDGITWNDIVLGFRFREDEDGQYELEHKPIGFERWYEVMSGNSNDLDPDGNPLIAQYTANIGIYGPVLQIDGGGFNDPI